MKSRKNLLLLLALSVAYGACMLTLESTPWSQLYSPSPYHRWQADALLAGHLWLANSIDAVELGLVWHNGHVQHVWGLGVGFWLLPFEAVWRLFGGREFPDRIALGIAFALLGFYAMGTGWEIMKRGRKTMGLGFVWIVLLFPPLWTLTRASTSIFEQTVLYAVIVSLGILVSLARVVLLAGWGDYAACFALSSFAVWMRPTHAVYGLVAVAICSLLLLVRRKGWKMLLLGNGCFVVSLALLGLTNYERFGSPAEFGHHLTVTTGNMVYMTRFGNPFREATALQAGRELAGMLFFEPSAENANTFGDNICRWQAPVTRWRKLDTTVFDVTYVGLALLACIAVALCLRAGWQFGRCGSGSDIPDTVRRCSTLKSCVTGLRSILGYESGGTAVVLFLWAGTSFMGLAVFYLYYPAMASRYLFDFLPAMVGFAVVIWMMIPQRFSVAALSVLAIWLLVEIGYAKVPSHSLAAGSLVLGHREPGVERQLSIGQYSADHPPMASGLSWNGNGWDAEDGFAENIVTLAVDNPTYVEIQVTDRRAQNGVAPRPDHYRAMIDGVMIPLRKIQREEDRVVVQFDVPQSVRQRGEDQVLFLCFSDGYDETDRHSERMLYEARWK